MELTLAPISNSQPRYSSYQLKSSSMKKNLNLCLFNITKFFKTPKNLSKRN